MLAGAAPGGTLLATLGTPTSYTDTGLTAGTRYGYTVSACDTAGNCSAQSAAVSATMQNNATSVNQKADCLFNWAESNYASLFAPRGTQSQSLGQFYLRYYSQTNAYLGIASDTTHLYYLGPLSANSLLDLGPVSTWFATAGCN